MVTAWLDDHRVRKISFTDSASVGRRLLRQAADRVINASMELGGSAPFIVTASADIAAAVDGAMLAKFRNGGQAWAAADTLFVHATSPATSPPGSGPGSRRSASARSRREPTSAR